MKPWIVVMVGLVVGAGVFASSPLWTTAPNLIVPCAVMALLCVLPACRWVSSAVRGIPVLEGYCLAHIPAYLLPVVNADPGLLEYGNDNRLAVIICVCTYLAALQLGAFSLVLIWRYFTPRLNLLRRDTSLVVRPDLIIMMLGVWSMFSLSVQLKMFPNIGAAYNIAVTMATASGLVGAYMVFLLIASGAIKVAAKRAALSLIAAGLVLQFTTGFLVGGAAIIAVCLAAYTLGKGKIPLLASVLCFFVLAFLHAGKAAVRERFWGEGLNYSESASNPLDVLAYWLSASTDAVLAPTSDSVGGILERGNTARALAWVMNATPSALPHLDGLTYYQIPSLLVPRLLWPDKPRGTAPTETLAIYYGFQTVESVEVTSIALGQIAEAWANFGWIGVAFIGTLLGALFCLPGVISRSGSPMQVGSLLGAMYVSKVFDVESCLGPWLVPLFNALLLGCVALWFLTNNRPLRSSQPSSDFPRLRQS